MKFLTVSTFLLVLCSSIAIINANDDSEEASTRKLAPKATLHKIADSAQKQPHLDDIPKKVRNQAIRGSSSRTVVGEKQGKNAAKRKLRLLSRRKIEEIDEKKQAASETTSNGRQQRRRVVSIPNPLRLSRRQIEEIDKEKQVYKETYDRRGKTMVQKRRRQRAKDLTTKKKEMILYAHLKRVYSDSVKCPPANDSEECRKMRSVFDADADGIMTKKELRGKTEEIVKNRIKAAKLEANEHERRRQQRRRPQNHPTK